MVQKLKVQVRKLENGDFCVDLGSKWFRIRKNRTVEAVYTVRSAVKRRPATPEEALFALWEIALRGAEPTP